jgi:outer membrane protein W
MKKRVFLVLLIAVFAASTAFAQMQLSAGGGAFFDSDFGGGVKASDSSGSFKIETPYSGGGIYGFFDATYVEVSMGYFFGTATFKTSSEIGGSSYSSEDKLKIQSLNFGLLGKFPIKINDSFSLFPLLGIEYKYVISLAAEDGSTPGDAEKISSFWIKAGVGGDISLTDNVYLRLNLLYGIRAPNKFEDDLFGALSGSNAETLNGHGLTAKIAIGFKF